MGPHFMPHHDLIDPFFLLKEIGLSLSHLVPEIIRPKHGLIFHQDASFNCFEAFCINLSCWHYAFNWHGNTFQCQGHSIKVKGQGCLTIWCWPMSCSKEFPYPLFTNWEMVQKTFHVKRLQHQFGNMSTFKIKVIVLRSKVKLTKHYFGAYVQI